MKTFYYETNSTQKNVKIGYLTEYGDFVDTRSKHKAAGALISQIVIKDGLYDGSWEQVCNRAAKAAAKELIAA